MAEKQITTLDDVQRFIESATPEQISELTQINFPDTINPSYMEPFYRHKWVNLKSNIKLNKYLAIKTNT